MKNRILFIATVVTLCIIGLGSILIRNSLEAQTKYPYEWPEFTMTYSVGGEYSTATRQLEWYSMIHWIDMVISNEISSADPKSPSLNYTGAKYEFNDGTYTTYDPNTQSSQSHSIEQGSVMSPAEWLVPGYQEILEHNGFQQTGTTSEGNLQFAHSESRNCGKDAKGIPLVEGCSPDQIVLEEYVFDPHGIPLSRVITVDGQIVENYKVTKLVLK